MTTMIKMKGYDYVARWPVTVAQVTGLARHEVLAVVAKALGTTFPGAPPTDDDVVNVLGGITPDQSRALIAAAHDERGRLYPHGRCGLCGLALRRSGDCGECDA